MMAICKHRNERLFEVRKSAGGRLMISKNGKKTKQTNLNTTITHKTSFKKKSYYTTTATINTTSKAKSNTTNT